MIRQQMITYYHILFEILNFKNFLTYYILNIGLHLIFNFYTQLILELN